MLVKDLEFNQNTVTTLATDIYNVYPSFNKDAFIKDSTQAFPNQELMERMAHVTIMLHTYLTGDYIEDIKILSEAMEPVKNWMFVYGSVIRYIEVYGCKKEHLDLSLEKLGEFTRLLSSEFAIRIFLTEFEDETLEKVHEWTKSDDVNKRRLASEGTRPNLPWGSNISVHYKKAAKVLENLYYDKERFVTRSCANHLNDISKIDPDFVIDTLKRWKKSNKQNKDEMDYIIKHSLRTLIKKGNLNALEFLGFNLTPKVEIKSLTLSSLDLKLGDTLEFEVEILPLEETKILVDYIIYYQMKNNKISKKVYKITEFDGKVNQVKKLVRKRVFKHMSTRKMHPGIHKIAIQVNGTILTEKEFNLIV